MSVVHKLAAVAALLDKFLTNASKMYVPTDEDYIGHLILPEVGVNESTGKLAGYGTTHLRILNSVMGGRGMARRVDTQSRSSDSYSIEDHGLEDIVTKSDFDNVIDPYDARLDVTNGLLTMMALGREKAIADVLSDTAIITQNVTLSGTSQFSDYANSDPIGRFSTARQAVYDGCGRAPDTAMMSWKVAEKLAYHPGILEALGFTQNRAGQLSREELAKALGVKRLLIGSAVYESAHLGQTSSLAPVWGKHIIFGVCPPAAAKRQVSLGYTVRKNNEKAREVFRYDIPNPPRSEGIIVTDNYDDLISNVGAAYLIKNAIA